jgi:hypothetical protein
MNNALKRNCLGFGFCVGISLGCTANVALAGNVTSQSAGAQATTLHRSFDNGAVAKAGFFDELSVMYLDIHTDSPNVPGATPTTAFLLIRATSYDPSSQVCEPDAIVGTTCRYTRAFYDLGQGEIPVADVSISDRAARLDTDISNSTYVFTRCTQDFVADTTTCTNVPPIGIVDVTWKRTSDDYEKVLGRTTTKTGPQVVKVLGSTKSYSASVVGSVIGFPVNASTVGQIGTTKSLTLDITQLNR